MVNSEPGTRHVAWTTGFFHHRGTEAPRFLTPCLAASVVQKPDYLPAWRLNHYDSRRRDRVKYDVGRLVTADEHRRSAQCYQRMAHVVYLGYKVGGLVILDVVFFITGSARYDGSPGMIFNTTIGEAVKSTFYIEQDEIRDVVTKNTSCILRVKILPEPNRAPRRRVVLVRGRKMNGHDLWRVAPLAKHLDINLVQG